MKPCRRVGLDVTWRCSWRCAHCFYRWGGNENGELGTPWDAPMDQLLAKVDKARARGIDHVVLEGFGEPTLMKDLGKLLLACRARGMTTSIITNGVQPTAYYARMYHEWGLDHLHISSHGYGDVLNEIAARPDAAAKQLRLKEWLHREQLPFRTNMTLQAANYRHIPETLERDADLGAFHVVMLGFLPHYEWGDPRKTAEVGVHPELLRPYVEEGARRMTERGTMFTIRYHPFCHLDPVYWKHVVNTRYVLWDSFEWNYSLQADDLPALWRDSVRMGDGASAHEPCNKCQAKRHCGGYNPRMVNGTGANLVAVTSCPPEYTKVWHQDGGIHDMNPVNHLDGITPDWAPDSRRNGAKVLPALAEEADMVIEEEYTTEPSPPEEKVGVKSLPMM